MAWRCRFLTDALSGRFPHGHQRDDRHDPRQNHGDPLARLDTGLEGAKNKLEEEERDERRRRLVDLQCQPVATTHLVFCFNVHATDCTTR